MNAAADKQKGRIAMQHAPLNTISGVQGYRLNCGSM